MTLLRQRMLKDLRIRNYVPSDRGMLCSLGERSSPNLDQFWESNAAE